MGNCASVSKKDTTWMTTTDGCTCCICQSKIFIRGGAPFMSLGCCGAFYHQDCISNMIDGGVSRRCPACRAQLPPSVIPTAIYSQATVPPTPLQSSAVTAPALPPFVLNRTHSHTWGQHSGVVIEMENSDIICLGNYEEDAVPPTATESQNRGACDVHQDTTIMLNSFAEFDEICTTDEVFRVVVSIDARCCERLDEAPLIQQKDVEHISPSSMGEDIRANPMDVICVLDRSGSMGSGGKMTNLLYAVDFVRGELSEMDRMGIIVFNNKSIVVHNLMRMSDDNKELTRAACAGITARGGTCILDGLKAALKMLEERRTSNPTAAVFLLTDGVDDLHTRQKKDIVSRIRSQGASIFVFGYGDDCDSKNLKTLAEAGDGSFCFVEVATSVTEAFGGALGAGKSVLARDLRLLIDCNPGVLINGVFSGNYKHFVSENRSSVEVTFCNLLMGEKRDVLLELRVAPCTLSHQTHTGPISDDRQDIIDRVALLSARLTFCAVDGGHEGTGEVDGECAVNGVPCIVPLGGANRSQYACNSIVDVQVNRQLFSRAIGTSTELADAGEFAQARSVLEHAIATIEASSSYTIAKEHICNSGDEDLLQEGSNMMTAGVVVGVESVAFVDELRQLLTTSLSSGMTYNSGGGRSNMYQTSHTFTRQRSAYTRHGSSNINQSQRSMSLQRQASMNRSCSDMG